MDDWNLDKKKSLSKYSLRLKMIVLSRRFFRPKMIARFIYPARNLRLDGQRALISPKLGIQTIILG